MKFSGPPHVFLAVALAALPAACAFAAPPTVPTAKTASVPAAAAVTKPAIEPAALALLQKSETAIFALKTYQADCKTALTYDLKPGETKPRPVRYETASLTAAKPNKMRYDQWTGKLTPAQTVQKTPTYTFVCDGKTHWRQYGGTYRADYQIKPEDVGTISEPWNGFYTKTSSPYGMTKLYQKKNALLEARKTGTGLAGGVRCDKVFTHIKTKYGDNFMEYRTTWYIGQKDGLMRRETEHIDFIPISKETEEAASDAPKRSGYTRDAVLVNIRTNAPIAAPAKTFAYTPPKGVQAEAAREANRPKLLAAGTPAPDFTAYDKNNNPVKLSDFKGKVVVVDFWASWCPPCIASMPHNQAVTQKLQNEGLPFVLLAVDDGEEKRAFLNWVKKHETELNTLVFVHSNPKTADISGKQYHVTGIPTQYVIDANGVIRASFVGFDDKSDALEKAIRAALPAGNPSSETTAQTVH